MKSFKELIDMSLTELLEFYSSASSEYDSWLADSFSTPGPDGKSWSEERCKLRARTKTREALGFIPEELRWVLRAKLPALNEQ